MHLLVQRQGLYFDFLRFVQNPLTAPIVHIRQDRIKLKTLARRKKTIVLTEPISSIDGWSYLLD
jgi:hypothetical protein